MQPPLDLIETITMVLNEHLPDDCRELILQDNPDGLLLLLYPEIIRVAINEESPGLQVKKWRIAIEDFSE